MKARRRTRAQTLLTVAALIILTVAVVSCFQMIIVTHRDASAIERSVSVARGAVYYASEDRMWVQNQDVEGWRHVTIAVSGPPRVQFLPRFHREYGARTSPNMSVCVPLWIPLLMVGGRGGWMWWRALRNPRDRCVSCGYDLAGLRGTICPECGEDVQVLGAGR